jgi:cytochrome c biogenesis factor
VGPSGALLVWAVALGLGASLASATLRRGSVLRAWTTALLAILLLAVLAMTCFDTNPFLRLPFPPDDGRGLALEWLRPIALVQMPLGHVAMALVTVPAVITVMGAMGTAPWRERAQRWAVACWGLLAAALVLDWRRRYGDSAWADDWRWAPVHAGTAFAWAGASLLVLATGRRWRADASIVAGFAAFTLALIGLTLRRAHGWDGVHALAGSAAGRTAAWLARRTSRAARCGWRTRRCSWQRWRSSRPGSRASATSPCARESVRPPSTGLARHGPCHSRGCPRWDAWMSSPPSSPCAPR